MHASIAHAAALQRHCKHTTSRHSCAAAKRCHPGRRPLEKTSLRASADDDGDRAQAKVIQQVEESAKAIEEMMAVISRELFLDSTVAYITEHESAEAGPRAVVSQVVGQRLEQLDSTFLATLDSYLQGARDKGAADVAEVLLLVREEVLARLAARLPPEMQLLDALLRAPHSAAREELLRQYALLDEAALVAARDQAAASPAGLPGGNSSGASGGGPTDSTSGGGDASGPAFEAVLYCLASDLESAASQVLGDMELMPQIPDRSLLARLVLAREEVQQLLLQHEFTGGGGTHEPGPDSDDARPGDTAARTLLGMRQPFTQLDAVPTSCAAFLQRLVAMPGPRERQALLRRAFSDDVEKLPGAGQTSPDATQRERLRAQLEAPQDWVRPGRFMLSLNALQAEMLGAASGGAGRADAAPVGAATLRRVESVRRDALRVLLELAGEPQAEEGGAKEEEEPFLP